MNMAAVEMLIACIGAAGCWFLWFYLIKEYRVSNFRESLFSLRDELFQFAADGHLTFDDPAYVELRSLINGMLRFAHRVTFLSLITSVRSLSADDPDQNPYLRWKDAVDHLAPDTKARVESIHNRLWSAFMRQLVKGSVFLIATSLLLTTGFFIRSQVRRFFLAKYEPELSPRAAMEKDLAKTINAESLVEAAYREGKASEKLELSLA
jgi:hypothetical protein